MSFQSLRFSHFVLLHHFHFFQFSDLPPSSVRSGYNGVTFDQDRGHHRASQIFQPTLTGISQRCHQKRTSEAVRISLRKHRLNCLPTTDRTQARPMLKEENLASTQLCKIEICCIPKRRKIRPLSSLPPASTARWRWWRRRPPDHQFFVLLLLLHFAPALQFWQAQLRHFL